MNLVRDRLDMPLRWRKPRKIFVNAQSDLFHDSVPDEYIAQVFAVMALARHHTFQVLTKRHARMRSLLSSQEFLDSVEFECESFDCAADWVSDAQDRVLAWPLPNVWLGVSTENQQWANIRIPALLDTPAAVRFISAEPLLGHIDLARTSSPPFWCLGHGRPAGHCPNDLHLPRDWGVDWVIVGGESGPGARPMHPNWAASLRDQCQIAGVPFLFKQWGQWSPIGDRSSRHVVMTDDGSIYAPGDLPWPDGPRRGEAQRADFPHHHPMFLYRTGNRAAGRELDGRSWDQYPVMHRASPDRNATTHIPHLSQHL